MSDRAIPGDVVRLIDARIQSVMELEAVLLLHTNPSKEWESGEMARALYIDANAGGVMLEELVRRGFARRIGPGRYAYEPSSAAVRATLDTLVNVYQERRVAITSLIYAKPERPMRQFSDAFRLRKDP